MNNFKKNVREIVMMIIVAVAAFVVEAAPLAGSGTEADPYRVSSVEDLLDFADSVNAGETTYNDYGVCVALTADLDMDEIDFPGIGTMDRGFFATFDGRGHTISNLSVQNMADNAFAVGFINYLGFYDDYTAGKLCNIRFVNYAAITDYDYGCSVGLVGLCDSGIIENVSVRGMVTAVGSSSVGAIVGWADMVTIENCQVSAEEGSFVAGVIYVGGLVGYADRACEINRYTVSGLAVLEWGWDYGNIVGYCIGDIELDDAPFVDFVEHVEAPVEELDELSEMPAVEPAANAGNDVEEVEETYCGVELSVIREIADYVATNSVGGAGFAAKDLDLVKFYDWVVASGAAAVDLDKFCATPYIFEAFAFNLPFDTFAAKGDTPSMSIKYLRDRPEEGWTTIVLCIKAGNRELAVNGINANVFVKHGNSIEGMEEELLPADRIVPFTCDEGGHATVALEVAPPAGSCHFFSVSIR